MPFNKPYDSTYITNNYDLFVFKGSNRDITRNERHIQVATTAQTQSIEINTNCCNQLVANFASLTDKIGLKQ